MFTQLAVGQPYAPMQGRPEGAVFEVSASGLLLLYNFSRPTAEEIKSMQRDAPFEIRFVTLQNVLYVMSKCGTTPWGESPYNPNLSMDYDKLIKPEGTEGFALTLAMIDASTNIVKSLRLIGLGNKFSQDLHDEIKRVRDMPFNIRDYNKTVLSIQASRTTKSIVDLAQGHRWKLK